MITVFGASVTQQKNGFAHRLENRIGHPVKVIGYGGMHLNNAAICFIDQVINVSPSYCFIDWFSTGYNKNDDNTVKYIDTIIYKLSNIKCKPIFLFFPFKGNTEKGDFYKFCKKILDDRCVTYIDVDNIIRNMNVNIDNILRDNIHTTNYGSDLYCEIISKSFIEKIDGIPVPKIIKKTEYTNIKKIEVNKVFSHNIQLDGECNIVGFLLSIGPHSGLIKISKNNYTYIENTWDRWCHYNRKQFNLKMNLSGDAKITILSDSFDTSSCKEPINFSSQSKYLVVHDIYFIGEKLNVVNINEGKTIKTQFAHIQNLKGRVKQHINKLIKKCKGRERLRS